MQKILFIAKNLHAKGYQNLKVIPSLSSSGVYWRCSFTSSEKNQDFDIIVSNWLQNKFDVSIEKIQLDLSELTEVFIKENKEFLTTCLGKNEEYVQWFKNMLEILQDEELPYAFADYFGPTIYWKTSLGKKLYLSQQEAVRYSSNSNENFENYEIEKIIKSFYQDNGYDEYFKNDLIYLQTSFDEIKNIWLENLEKIEKINYIMIAEAPLWGKNKKYIYNPKTNLSQFFYKSDLEEVLRISIKDKEDFIKTCNSIGLLIIDISPYVLNEKDTKLNYRTLGKKNYKKIVESTLPFYFNKKIQLIKSKLSDDTEVFFRYKRVKQNFEDLIGKTLLENKIIDSLEKIGDISQTGGGINKSKLKEIISKKYYS